MIIPVQHRVTRLRTARFVFTEPLSEQPLNVLTVHFMYYSLCIVVSGTVCCVTRTS